MDGFRKTRPGLLCRTQTWMKTIAATRTLRRGRLSPERRDCTTLRYVGWSKVEYLKLNLCGFLGVSGFCGLAYSQVRSGAKLRQPIDQFQKSNFCLF